MLRVRDIMTTDVATVTPDTPIRDAMELLVKLHISGAPVLEGDALVGVVTSTDLMAFVSETPGVPTERDTVDVLDDSVDEPAVPDSDADEPALAFFIDLWDDVGAEVTARASSLDGPEWSVLDEHDVSEAMTRPPLVTLPADASVDAAADLITTKGVHRVLITDGGRLVGIVSVMDITRVVAGGDSPQIAWKGPTAGERASR